MEQLPHFDSEKRNKKLPESVSKLSRDHEKFIIAQESQKQVALLDSDQIQSVEWMKAFASVPVLPHSGARLQDGGLNEEIEHIAFAGLPVPLNDL